MPDLPPLTDKSCYSAPRRQHRLHGQKPPLKPREVWAIRVRLQIQGALRDLALFNLAIDSKLRSCDLVALRVADVATAGSIRERAMIVQQKTGHPVRFELTDQTRESVLRWITQQALGEKDYLFPSRRRTRPHLSTRQYARIVNPWVAAIIGLDPCKYGTHSLRRTKAAVIYRETGNLRAVQLLLGHTKLESTVRYLGVEVDDVLRIAEQVEL